MARTGRPGWGRRLRRWAWAVFLLWPAAALSWAVADLVWQSVDRLHFWVPLLCGALCWGVVFAWLPRPAWLYVVGHELTHALWTWMFGGRVKSFRVSSAGGEVVVSKSNSWITLAPYFFPLYAVLWAGGYLLLHWATGWDRDWVGLHLGLGFAYGFHVTLTWQVLRLGQPDLAGEGWVFSGVFIWNVHALLLLLVLPGLTGTTTLTTALGMAVERAGRVIQVLGRLLNG